MRAGLTDTQVLVAKQNGCVRGADVESLSLGYDHILKSETGRVKFSLNNLHLLISRVIYQNPVSVPAIQRPCNLAWANVYPIAVLVSHPTTH